MTELSRFGIGQAPGFSGQPGALSMQNCEKTLWEKVMQNAGHGLDLGLLGGAVSSYWWLEYFDLFTHVIIIGSMAVIALLRVAIVYRSYHRGRNSRW